MEGTASNNKRSRRTPAPPREDTAAEKLTDDLLVEILSRVPYKPLCRFRCVSRRWRRVISHPDHRRLLPRYHLETTLAGFFQSRSFINITWEGRPLVVDDPSLPFLPKYDDVEFVDSCNGLLLCRCWTTTNTDRRRFDYLVVNPAIKRWVVLPESGLSDKKMQMKNARLGFDPAVSSSHFHVFEFDIETVKGVEIYSSKTGVWTHRDNGWGYEIRILYCSNSVFFNNVLHLIAMEHVVAAVDAEGNTWRLIPMPQSLDDPVGGVDEGFIDLSQGCLYFVNTNRYEPNKLSVWVLEDYSNEQWTWKHTVSHLHLFGTSRLYFGYSYKVISIHPEKNIILLVFPHNGIVMSYELDSRAVHYIYELGRISRLLYLPYVPLYSESLADGH